MKAIPIDAEGSPKELIKSLRDASEALDHGETLVIFPEGAISRTGVPLPFKRGFEQIVKRANVDVQIVPAYIDGVWGSIFSFQGGKFFGRWPRLGRTPVRVMFGKPMPKSTTADQARVQVQLLSAEAAFKRKSVQVPLQRKFIRIARHFAKYPHMMDANTPMQTFGDTLIRATAFSQVLATGTWSGSHDRPIASAVGCGRDCKPCSFVPRQDCGQSELHDRYRSDERMHQASGHSTHSYFKVVF